jgi:hypothetical protein
MSSVNNSTTTTIIIAAVFLVFLYFVFSSPGPVKNEGALVTSSNGASKANGKSGVATDKDSDVDSTYTADDSSYVDLSVSMGMNRDDDDSVDSSIENIKERAMGRNNLFFRRRDGAKYRRNSYRDLDSGSLDQIEGQFGVQDVTKNYTDRFVPLEENSGMGAPIDIGARKNTDKDKYDVNGFLPQEEEKDWFETIEQVDVKNSNLINIYRPIGVNTIGSSQKAASYDIRGYDGAVAPKFVSGPWLQSSYEPDRSTKSLC